MTQTTSISYGIVNNTSGKLLTYTTYPNVNGEYCCDERHFLSSDGYEDEPQWLVETKAQAIHVLNNSCEEWYNQYHSTPEHSGKISPETHRVVKVTTVITLDEI